MLIHFVGPKAAKRRLRHRRASVRVAGGQQKRAKQDLTARLAASLSSNARATQRDGEASAAGSMDLNEREWESVDGSCNLNEREWESVDGSGSGDASDGDSQRSVAQKASRDKRRRVAQLDPPQPKDDRLREVIHAGNHAGQWQA